VSLATTTASYKTSRPPKSSTAWSTRSAAPTTRPPDHCAGARACS
jgi:hypothetical protein